MKILVVDDKSSVRAAMKKILKGLGFDDITEAVDGNNAWFKLKAEFEDKKPDIYDLIISDMEMPEMSGLDLLRAVREDGKIKDTPFIMVTASNSKEVILETIKLKIKAYIIKPFNTESVKKKFIQAGFIKPS